MTAFRFALDPAGASANAVEQRSVLSSDFDNQRSNNTAISTAATGGRSTSRRGSGGGGNSNNNGGGNNNGNGGPLSAADLEQSQAQTALAQKQLSKAQKQNESLRIELDGKASEIGELHEQLRRTEQVGGARRMRG
jgi:hypothetical protein